MSSTDSASYSYSDTDSGSGSGTGSYSYSDSSSGSGSGSASYSYSDTGSGSGSSGSGSSGSGSSGSGSGSSGSSGTGSYSYSSTGSESGSSTGASDTGSSGSGSSSATGSYSYSYSDSDSGSGSGSGSKSGSSGSDYSYSYSSESGSKTGSDYSYSYSGTPSGSYSYSYSYSDSADGKTGKGKGDESSYSYSYSYSDESGKGGKTDKGSEGSYYSYSGDYSGYYSGEYYTDDYYSDDGYYSDYTGSYYEYSDDSQYMSEFTRERLNYLPLKDWFSDLPEPAVQKTQRRTRDVYFEAIQENIVNLRMHIRQIQIEEQQLLLRYCKHLLIEEQAEEKPREKDVERARLNFLEQLSHVRKSRKQYRALLYDAITQRNNMIEAAEIREQETKNRDMQLWSLGRHREVDYFLFFLFSLQMIAMLLVIIFFDFDFTTPSELAKNITSSTTPIIGVYSLYTDSALMLFAGFGFLMTFVKKYSFSGLSYGFLISAFAMQWSLVWLGIWSQISDTRPLQKINLSIPALQSAIYGATAVAISCGAVLGRLDPLQLALMTVFETFFFSLNLFITDGLSQSHAAFGMDPNGGWYNDMYTQIFGRIDPGGGMLVHLFGCYFGLALSMMFRPPPVDSADQRDDRDERTDYTSNTFAFFGTALMFVLFPSFNAAHAYGNNGGPQRVVINTILGLCGSVGGAFMVSHSFCQTGNKFGPIEIHHATLAGGVAMASSAVYFVPPVAAVALGWFVGVISCLSYLYLTPALKRFLRLNDTAGTHSLHGLPALLGSAISLILVALSESIFEATKTRLIDTNDISDSASSRIMDQFPSFNSTTSVGFTYDIEPIDVFAQTGAEHAATHALVLAITFGLALCSGCFVGIILKAFNFFFRTALEDEEMYSDKTAFIVPQDYPEE